MEKSTIIFPFPVTEIEIIKDNLEEYNNYITQKNKTKEQYKIAKQLILDSAGKKENLLDMWEGELQKKNINDNYENIKKIIYYDNNTNNSLGIQLNDEVAKYFIDNYRLDANNNYFLFNLYPNSFQSQTTNYIVIMTDNYIYFTNNNLDCNSLFNIISL